MEKLHSVPTLITITSRKAERLKAVGQIALVLCVYGMYSVRQELHLYNRYKPTNPISDLNKSVMKLFSLLPWLLCLCGITP